MLERLSTLSCELDLAEETFSAMTKPRYHPPRPAFRCLLKQNEDNRQCLQVDHHRLRHQDFYKYELIAASICQSVLEFQNLCSLRRALERIKMCSKEFKAIVLLSLVSLVLCQSEELYPRGPVEPPLRRPPPDQVNNNLDRGWAPGFMSTARNFVASPTGQFAVSMAKEFISRSAGGNQVLSLNLSSLLIIVLLKALVFSTGLLGAGNWGQYGRGRGLESSK